MDEVVVTTHIHKHMNGKLLWLIYDGGFLYSHYFIIFCSNFSVGRLPYLLPPTAVNPPLLSTPALHSSQTNQGLQTFLEHGCSALILTKAPFAHLRLSFAKGLTWKTLFLLVFMTAQRVDVVQALSHRTSWQKWELLVSYLPEFFQNRYRSTQAHRLPQVFYVRNLSTIVGVENEESLLCHVWAQSCYLHRIALDTKPRTCSLLLSVPPSLCWRQRYSFSLWDTINQRSDQWLCMPQD